jgi:hypothetical protein
MEGETNQDLSIPLAHLYQDSAAERKIFGPGYQLGDLVNIVTLQPLIARKFVVLNGYIDYADTRKESPTHLSRNPADWDESDHQFLDRGDGRKPHPYVNKRMNFLCLFEGEDWPVVLRFKKTGINAGRNLNTMVKMQRAKNVFGLYEYTTKDGNSESGSYVVPAIKLVGPAPEEMSQKATDLFNALNGKSVDVQEGDASFNPEELDNE